MSLVSRMTDFFAASDSSSLASSSGSSSGMGLGGLQDGRLVDVGERMNTAHAQHAEPQEAVRPPYLHVRNKKHRIYIHYLAFNGLVPLANWF